MEDRNPLLDKENYFAGYEKSINDLKNNPELIEFDRLCFELFEKNEQGRRFIELVKERYLLPGLAAKGTATYQLDIIWGEGFKDFVRHIISSLKSHQQRILAGK